MSVIGSSILAGASGSAGGDKVYVDDVFSTFLWEGNSTAGRNIVNGVDLAGEGGLVWTKQRDGSRSHYLYDTENSGYALSSDLMSGKVSASNRLTAFNNNGFTLGSDSDVNQTSSDYASWTFRKAPGFFDVVTYAGSGSVQTIPHSLGSEPGMILIKNLTTSIWWGVYHRSLATDKYLRLNETGGELTSTAVWNQTRPTATEFTVGVNGQVSGAGNNFVAYIFAHDDAQFGTDEDESIIKCGSFTHSTSSGNEINLGFEPQWLIYKKSSGTSEWYMWDTMRGWSVTSQSNLRANQSNAESTGSNTGAGWPQITSTGFKLGTNNFVGDNATYIYMAIRRPNKPPTAATEVFAVATGNSSNPIPAFVSNFTVDAAFLFNFNGGYDNYLLSRLTGDAYLRTNTTNKQTTNTGETFDSNTGWARIYNSTYQSVMFKRAPGFMDVVTWVGDGNPVKNVSHNLKAVPEMVISKMRLYSTSSSYGGDRWYVYHKDVNGVLGLNSNGGIVSSTGIFNSAPTATNLPFDNPSYDSLAVNGSGSTYIAYLFATLPGISKVGSFSGTGSAINVDCGFTNGARFILIKRINGTGDWYLWDSLRGIVSGNDPYLLLNVNTTQTTNTDYIDPNIYGFTVTSSAPAALNTSGGTYLFLAIA